MTRSLILASLLALQALSCSTAEAGTAQLHGPETARVNVPEMLSTAGTDGVPVVAFSQNTPSPAAELRLVYTYDPEADAYVPYGAVFTAFEPGLYEIVCVPEDDGTPPTPDVLRITVVGEDPEPEPEPDHPEPPAPGPGPDPEPTPGPDLSARSVMVRDAARSQGVPPKVCQEMAEVVFRTMIAEINANHEHVNDPHEVNRRFEQLIAWYTGYQPEARKLMVALAEVMRGADTLVEQRTRFFEIAEGLEAVQ